MSARALFTEWLTFLASEKRASPRTVRAYGDDVERWLDFLMRHLGTAPDAEALKTLSAGDLRAFLASRRGEGLSARSLARTLASVRAFHRFLERRKSIANAALMQVAAPKQPRTLPRPLAADAARQTLVEAGATGRGLSGDGSNRAGAREEHASSQERTQRLQSAKTLYRPLAQRQRARHLRSNSL